MTECGSANLHYAQLHVTACPAAVLWTQAGNPGRNRYEQARNFVPPGRLMFLRPIKSAAKERRSNRQYKPVWITAQVILLAFCVSLCKHQYVFPLKLLAQKALRLMCSDQVESFAICLGAWMSWGHT